MAYASAPLRSLSLGRRRSTRACCARAPWCAGGGRPLYDEGALYWREAAVLQRAAVVGRANYGLHESAGFRVARASAPLRSLSLRRRRSTRACRAPCCACVPCCAGRDGPCLIKGHCAGERPLFFGSQPWCDVPAGASKNQGFRVARASAPLRLLSLGRRRSTRASCCCARCAALVVVVLCTTERRWIGEKPLLRCAAVVRRTS